MQKTLSITGRKMSTNAKTKIAIDATIISSSEMDGLNRYTCELIKGLIRREGEFVTYKTTEKIKGTYDKEIKNIPNLFTNINKFNKNLLRFVWHQTYLPISLKKENVSVLYSTTPEGMLLPLCKQVITIHDIIPFLYPNSHPRLRHYYQWILPYLIKASTAIITVSESTKKDIEKYYSTYTKPIYVVYQGCNEDIFQPASPEQIIKVKEKYNLNDFILCVGEIKPYKNIRKLIEAFAKIISQPLKLAIVGKLNDKDKYITNLPQELFIADKVKFFGYIPDEDLGALYSGAKSFVFPSLYEGFGIPPLEAMACGCPVVVSQVSSLPEVCGDAAYYVDPYSVDSIAEGIYKVSTNSSLQASLRQKGFERVKNFSYGKAADQIIEILNHYK